MTNSDSVELAYDLNEVKESLERAGATVIVSSRPHILEVRSAFGPEAPLLIRWLPGKRAVHFNQPLPIQVHRDEDLAQTALTVARVNQSLPTPALVLDIDAGWIDYRARLFADHHGGLDVELCAQMLKTIGGHVERLLPLIDHLLRGEDADLDLVDSVGASQMLWRAYSE